MTLNDISFDNRIAFKYSSRSIDGLSRDKVIFNKGKEYNLNHFESMSYHNIKNSLMYASIGLLTHNHWMVKIYDSNYFQLNSDYDLWNNYPQISLSNFYECIGDCDFDYNDIRYKPIIVKVFAPHI